MSEFCSLPILCNKFISEMFWNVCHRSSIEETASSMSYSGYGTLLNQLPLDASVNSTEKSWYIGSQYSARCMNKVSLHKVLKLG